MSYLSLNSFFILEILTSFLNTTYFCNGFPAWRYCIFIVCKDDRSCSFSFFLPSLGDYDFRAPVSHFFRAAYTNNLCFHTSYFFHFNIQFLPFLLTLLALSSLSAFTFWQSPISSASAITCPWRITHSIEEGLSIQQNTGKSLSSPSQLLHLLHWKFYELFYFSKFKNYEMLPVLFTFFESLSSVSYCSFQLP